MGSIVSVDEADKRKGSIGLDGFTRSYSRTFIVVTSDSSVEQLQVKLATGIPRVGDFYSVGTGADQWIDFGALCRTVSAEPLDPDERTVWIVTVDYSSKTGDAELQQGGGVPGLPQTGSGGGDKNNPQLANPLFAPYKVRWGSRKVPRTRLTTVDVPPLPIVNSAGEPFDPPPSVEVSLRTCTVTRPEIGFSPFGSNYFENKTNSGSFQGRAAGRVLCESITGDYAFENGVNYWLVTYEFLFAPHHDAELLDKGHYYLEGPGGSGPSPGASTNVRVTPKTKTGQSVGEVLLDGLTGARLADGAEPETLRFKIRESADFDDLHMPQLYWGG